VKLKIRLRALAKICAEASSLKDEENGEEEPCLMGWKEVDETSARVIEEEV
jgi:hypothetical protein